MAPHCYETGSVKFWLLRGHTSLQMHTDMQMWGMRTANGSKISPRKPCIFHVAVKRAVCGEAIGVGH